MKFISNILWLVFGGFFSALAYVWGGLILCMAIVGIPFGLQCFKLAGFVIWPFGNEVIEEPRRGGCLSLFANIIWILSGGVGAAVNHLFWAVIWTVTIVGIPFARKHFALITLSLMPFGKKIVPQRREVR